MKDFNDLKRVAESFGFFVTSTTGGSHNVGSKHYKGLAIDVRTRDKTAAECDSFIKKFRALGVTVRDERVHPQGQKVWSGSHIHLEIADGTGDAVKKFQGKNNLDADGIVGSLTLAALDLLV